MMHEKKLEVYLFFILLALALYLVFSIFSPYLYAIILAIVFAVIFAPLHTRIGRILPKHKSLSALMTVLTVVIIVLIPLIFFGVQLSDEIKNLYDYAFTASEGVGFIGKLTDAANNLLTKISPFGFQAPVFDAVDTESYVLSSLAWVRGHFGDIFSGLAKLFVNLFLFLIALYYFIKDGHKFRREIVEISPFKDERDETILDKLKLAILSIVKGSILVSLMQGALSMIGFSIFGVPSPVLWGSVAIVAALIPGLGTSLVLLPAILFLFFTGSTGAGIGLLIWGVVAVGLIDNIVGPFLILISALGGIGYFGAIGFLLGPIALSFLFTLLDIYKTIIIKDRQNI
jgi:predicted PurR-regulated permease PerM